MDWEISSEALNSTAWKLYNQGDFLSALRVWKTVRKLFPQEPDAYRGAALSLKKLGEFENADLVLLEGIEQYPSNQNLLAEYAWLAHHNKKWTDAIERWEGYYNQFPNDFVGFLCASIALRELRRYDDADEILDAGLKAHPDNSQLVAGRAWVAQHRNDWGVALDRWKYFHSRFPNDPIGYSSLGVVLRELRRYKEADAVLEKGLTLFPNHPELVGNYAWVAYHAHDWPQALQRWTKYRDQFPTDPAGHYQTMLVLGELGRFEEANMLAGTSVKKNDLPDPEVGRFMLTFESLGDNCEFGVVQRYYGAEPLGLLRFTATPSNLLILALNSGFSGVGDPENTTLMTHNGEYITGDKRYHMSMHTFIKEAGDDRAKRFGNVCRRIRFLRDKFLQDLRGAEKLFVYACREPHVDDQIRELWAALRRYGDNRLLFVGIAKDNNSAGSVRQIEDTLVAGYLDKLSVDNPSFEIWLRICQQASKLLGHGGRLT